MFNHLSTAEKMYKESVLIRFRKEVRQRKRPFVSDVVVDADDLDIIQACNLKARRVSGPFSDQWEILC